MMLAVVIVLLLNSLLLINSNIDPHSRETPHEGRNLVINVGLPNQVLNHYILLFKMLE